MVIFEKKADGYFFELTKEDGFVKSRHTREGGYPESLQLLEKTGFPIKDFGNDGMKKDFLRDRQSRV